MDRISLYIQEVTRRLPEKMREDISLELHSTILDMLPEDFTKNDVDQVLDKLGNPAVLASRYQDQPMHLIGPKFYDMYITVLKMTLMISVIVSIVIFSTEKIGIIFESEASSLVLISKLLGEAIWILINTGIQSFFWVTIVFIIIERTVKFPDDTAISLSGKKWVPSDLDSIPYIPLKKKITIGEVVFSLFWPVLFIILYLNAANIIGIYQQDSNGLQFTTPVFNQDTLMAYLVIVIILVGLEIFGAIYKAIARQWTFKLAVSNIIINIGSTVFLIFIASNPNLMHAEFAPYMANLLDQSIQSINIAITWIKWFTVATVIVTSGIDSYNGFRKAKIK